jgi:polysaccharide export outer membrane protein
MQTPNTASILRKHFLQGIGALLACVVAGTAGAAQPATPRATTPAPPPAPPPAASIATEPVLGPGDTVRVIVAENPDLTTEGRLSQRGSLGMPLLGEVALTGRTLTKAAEFIASELLRNRYVRNPHVSVSLIEARSQRVQILGHVAKPGQYALDGTNNHLTDILAMAGGRTAEGSDVVVVTRRAGSPQRIEVDVAGMYRDGDLSRDISLEAGDMVYVPTAPVFYVYGAVQRAGMYRLAPDTSVRAALSLGGGLTQRASQRGISVNRRMPDGKIRQVTVRLDDEVEANDVIFVKESLF